MGRPPSRSGSGRWRLVEKLRPEVLFTDLQAFRIPRRCRLPAWDATKEKVKELGEKAAPTWDATKEKAGEAVQDAQPFWEKTKQRAKEMSRKALDAASDAARKAKEAGKELMQGDTPKPAEQ